MKKNKVRTSLFITVAMLEFSCLPAMAMEGWTAEGGSWYYYDASGHKVKDSWIVDKIGTTPNYLAFYLDADGKWQESAIYPGSDGKWIQDNAGWWFERTDGTYPQNEYEYIDQSWYFFNEHGYMITGLYTNEETGTINYFYTNGAMAEQAGWIELSDGSWIYVKGKNCISDAVTPDGYPMNENGIWQQGGRQTIVTDTLTLTIPTSWEGKYYYLVNANSSVTFYEKLNHTADNTLGRLFTIHTGTEEQYKQQESIGPVKRVKQENATICFLSYPTDIEWLPELETAYKELYNDQESIQSILDSIQIFSIHNYSIYYNRVGERSFPQLTAQSTFYFRC